MNFSVKDTDTIPPKINFTNNGRSKMPKSAGVASSSTGSGRRKAKKVKLGPGFSQMDWIKLNRKITPEKQIEAGVTRIELQKHNTQYDCWMVLRGKVYNVTKYIPYHPGGFDEVMKGAGIDGTKLFDSSHQWVSIDGFLENCYVGDYVGDETGTKKDEEDDGGDGLSWDDLMDEL